MTAPPPPPQPTQPYLIYTVAFVLGVYCNMRALAHSNVETVIIFRSCTPLAVSLCDWLFLGRELPSRRSLAALLTIAAGTCVLLDSLGFNVRGVHSFGWDHQIDTDGRTPTHPPNPNGVLPQARTGTCRRTRSSRWTAWRRTRGRSSTS